MHTMLLQRACQSATPVPQHKCILCCFSWKTMRVCSECVLSASRCRQSAQPLQTERQGGGGTPRVMEPGVRLLGPGPFSHNPRLFPCHLGFLPTVSLDCFLKNLSNIHIRNGLFTLVEEITENKQAAMLLTPPNLCVLTLCDHIDANKQTTTTQRKRKTIVLQSKADASSMRILYYSV